MKKGDPFVQHHERMRELHASFTKKAQYHKAKAFIELKDIYWLVHEFFSVFLQKEHHFTEEELAKELKEFKHEFFSMPEETVEGWKTFLLRLSHCQYSGIELTQEHLQALIDEFSRLVDSTIGKEYVPPDEVTRQVQEAQVYVKHGDLDHAEEIYRRIMHGYDKLSMEKRREHYEQLQRLYTSIADARSGPATTPR